MTDLRPLIDRVEKASGPDRQLDCDICVAIGWFRRDPARNHYDFKHDYIDIRDPAHLVAPGHGGDQLVPRITASFEAAMTLRPGGMKMDFTLREDDTGYACIWTPHGNRSTSHNDFVLAVLSAILKARQTLIEA